MHNVSELTARTNDEGWPSVFEAWLRVGRLRQQNMLLIFSVGGGDARRQAPGEGQSGRCIAIRPANRRRHRRDCWPRRRTCRSSSRRLHRSPLRQPRASHASRGSVPEGYPARAGFSPGAEDGRNHVVIESVFMDLKVKISPTAPAKPQS